MDMNWFTRTASPSERGLSGYWTRRIALEHRLVYRVDKGVIKVIQCRYHY